jgi:chemotaxis protein histidine kinase CheA
VRLFSGATLSGEGNVRLILDIPTIIERELARERPNQAAPTATAHIGGADDDDEFEAC